jgi:hypothetical protein
VPVNNPGGVPPGVRGIALLESPIVANRGVNVGQLTTATLAGAAQTDGQARISHAVAVDATDLRFVFQNYQAGTTNVGEASGANNISVRGGLELADGTVLPIYFRGSRDAVLEPDSFVVSDPIPVDVTAGDVIWSRTRWTVTAGQTVPVTRRANAAWVQAEGSELGTGTADKTLTGTISATTSTASSYSPTAVLGRVKVLATNVIVIGDSIPSGTGDAISRDADGGYVQQAFDALKIPYLRVTRSGESAQAFAALSTSRRRRILVGGATHALCTYGTNDIFSNTRTLAQVQADLLAIWTMCFRRGIKVIQTTITPRTNTTDGWVTTVNQTTTSAGQETVRRNLNAWIRAGSPIDPVTKVAVAVGTGGALLAGGSVHPLAVTAGAPSGFVEIADVVEPSRDSGLWAVPSPVISGTGDITNGGFTIANATASLQVPGLALVGTGIGGDTRVILNVGSTLTVTKAPTATTNGLAISGAYTGDGVHPANYLHGLMANVLTAAVFS